MKQHPHYPTARGADSTHSLYENIPHVVRIRLTRPRTAFESQSSQAAAGSSAVLSAIVECSIFWAMLGSSPGSLRAESGGANGSSGEAETGSTSSNRHPSTPQANSCGLHAISICCM